MSISQSIRCACIGILIAGTACRGGNTGYGAEDSPAGLRQVMERFYQAARTGDDGALGSLCASLVLPDAAAWFARVFGPEKGGALAAGYREQQDALVPQVREIFRKIAAAEQSEIRVDRFSDPGDGRATGLQQEALAGMRERTALYSARFVKPGESYGMHLWSFVHADGAFRLVGKLRPARR